MTPDLPPPSPIDGIAPPAPVQETPVEPKPPVAPAAKAKRGPMISGPMLIFAIVAVLYVVPAIALLVIFPTEDGSLKSLKSIATMVFAFGTIGWLIFGAIGFLRIAAIKDRPRMRTFGLLRLVAMVLPMALIGGATAFMINVPPQLSMDILSPASSKDLVAPITVTFGLQSALKLIALENLSPLKYDWDFNGDSTVDQQTFDPQATYIYKQAGVFTVGVRITMTNGATKKVTKRLLIPRSSFGVQPSEPIIDEPVSFSIEHLFPKVSGNAAPKLSRAQWDFDGDGIVDLDTDKLTASTVYHKLGAVSATVTMALSNQTQSILQRTLQVVKPAEQPFPVTLETEPPTLLGPAPFGVLFTLKTKEPIANASWDFGDGKTGEGLRVAHVFPAVGNFTTVVLARSASGTTAKLSKVIRVTNSLELRDLAFEGSPPVKSFAIEGDVPLSIDLTPVTSQPLISFSWDAPTASEVQTTEKGIQAVYREAGRYFIDLIGIDPDQNVFRKRITVTAKAPQSAVTFTMDPETPTAPALVTFDASDTFIPNGEEITGFEWDFGDDSNAGDSKFSGSSIQHKFEKAGTYQITLSVRTTSGKVFTGKQTLVVRAPLTDACFLPSRRTGKAPLGVRFDSACSTGNFTSWLWDFGDSSQSDQQNPTHVFLKAGEFTVTFTATTSDGLKSVKTSVISVTE